MKQLLITTILVFAVATINAQELSKKERKAALKAEKIEQIKALIQSGNWQFNALQMIPMRGKSKSLTTSYSVTLQEKEVDSYLPFYGRAYRAEYGPTESPLTFKTDITDYSIENWKKGGWIIKISAKNKSDLVQFTFTISETGTTTLSINSTNLESISYYGDIVKIKEKKEP